MATRFLGPWIAVSMMWLPVVGSAAAPHTVPFGAVLTEGLILSEPIGDARSECRCPPYLGLEPPGRSPELFAPGIMTQENRPLHGAVVVSPDGQRICWSVLPPAIVCTRCEDGAWSDPRILHLPGNAVQAPAFSADGSRLYYQAVGDGGLGSLDIWWVDARKQEWEAASNIGPPVNGPGAEGQPTLTGDGEIFFSGTLEGVEYGRGIFHAERRNGGYDRPQALPDAINSSGIDFYPFVTGDGNRLLFASNRGHSGEELYIHVVFRSEEGAWTEPVDIHPFIGFRDTARFPSVTPDGRFLFFWSEGRIWWVDAAALPVRDVR